MMKMLLVMLLVLGYGADEGDWVDPNVLPVTFQIHPFYAGFLNISSTKAYYYVYTPSFKSPSSDPLMVMLSTGPGCSCLHSWLYSKGEFIFPRNATDFATSPNPFNWNRQANVLYIEGPAGVGFSTGKPQNQSDDSITADYFDAILKFYQKFSQLKDQTMYLTGQQYSGVVAPRLALNIIQHNRNPQTPSWLHITFGGMFLLNPCTFGDECNHHTELNQYSIQSLRNKFFISDEVYEEYRSSCVLNGTSCVKVKQKIETAWKTTGADIRNLYKPCLNQPGEYPCIDHIGIETVMNLPTVQQDLNVFTPTKWTFCNPIVEETYIRDGDGSLHIYETLLREEHNLRIWIVSGTLSSLVPTLGTKKWFEEIKARTRRPSTRLWAPWLYQGINAGDYQEIPGLTFISIRAGYYMFNEQPEMATHIYDSFIRNVTLE